MRGNIAAIARGTQGEMSDGFQQNSFIPVVAAVIVRAGRLLLCQRHDGPHLPLLWEFPGGKIDPGEAPAEALARELREELGVAARIGPRIHEVRHSYPEKNVWIRFYAASISGTPRPRIHRDVRWVDFEELTSYTVPPPNAKVVKYLVEKGIASISPVRAPSVLEESDPEPSSD